eukprot:3407210-Rhodomonas_salina.1
MSGTDHVHNATSEYHSARPLLQGVRPVRVVPGAVPHSRIKYKKPQSQYKTYWNTRSLHLISR